jgi:hypothetical protein
MGPHEDALAHARKAKDSVQEEEVARNRLEHQAIAQAGLGCRDALADWMVAIGMTPRPAITLKDNGLIRFHDSPENWGYDGSVYSEWSITAWRTYGKHSYRARYGTVRGLLAIGYRKRYH